MTEGFEDNGIGMVKVTPMMKRFHFSNPLCLVNLNLLSEALWCNVCDVPLSLRCCVQERMWRNTHFLKVKCHLCVFERSVLLCNDDPDDETYHDPERLSCDYGAETLAETLENGVEEPDICENYALEDCNDLCSQKSAKSACTPYARRKRGRPPIVKRKVPGSSDPLEAPRRSTRGRLLPRKVNESKKRVSPAPSSIEDVKKVEEEEIQFDWADQEEFDYDDQGPLNRSEEENEPEENDKKVQTPCCSYCQRQFRWKKQLVNHMKAEHPEVRAFFCELCSEEFTTIYFLRKHKRESHLPKNSPKCETCGQAFPTLDVLEAHKKRHLPKDARQFKCSRCSKKFFEAKRLNVHFLRFHKKVEGEFKCAHCPRSYETKRQLLRHIIEHVQDDIYAIKHKDEFARWKCEYCDKIFKNMGRQLVHMRECHPEFKALICGWCGEQCTTGKAFQKHRRLNHRPDSLYVCDECGRAFLNPRRLKLHKVSHRTDNEGKEFLCSYCPRAFAENSSLADHIKRFHVITTYYCEHCPKTFKMKFNIRRHMQLHTGEFRHSCPFCGANFVAADGRDHHIRNCHRFMCVVCSSIFPTKDEVVMHRIREHPSVDRAREGDTIFEKITDYNCEVCFRYLSSKQALNTHLRTHTKRKRKEEDSAAETQK